MARLAVVTDSTSDLAPDAAAAAGIRVVPLFVRFASEEFQVGVDLSPPSSSGRGCWPPARRS